MATPPGMARGTSAGRPPSTTSQQSAVANRADVIKRAEQLFVQGQWKKAADLMAKAAAFFVGDEEITALMVQYREKANQVDEVLARMAALAQQNRWCEVSQIIAELQQSGVSVKGVEQYAAAAQQKFGALQPLVATAKSLLQQGRAAEAAAHANRALQYVADHAEALEIVEMASKRSTRRRRSRRFVVGLLAVACLAAIAGGTYLYFTESVVIDKARRQIANREYEDASQTLADLPHRWFVDREATYLQAQAGFEEVCFREGDRRRHTAANLDPTAERCFQCERSMACAGEAGFRGRGGPGAFLRCRGYSVAALKIAHKLNELKVVEPAVLAEALLTKAEGRSEFQSPASEATPVRLRQANSGVGRYEGENGRRSCTSQRRIAPTRVAGDPKMGRKDAFAGRYSESPLYCRSRTITWQRQTRRGQAVCRYSEADRHALRYVGLLGKALSES